MSLRPLLVPVLFSALLSASAAASDVRVVSDGGRYQLVRDGKPYFIRGAGGDRFLDALAAVGGNSFRTWGDEKLGEQLDAAQQHGLTVTAGIWLGQVRQGFDYTDAESLARQREHVRATVLKFKDHPALLIWALGNEMEDPQGKNGAVWAAINSLAAMVRQIDPHHPTMTVIAEIGGDKVKNIHRLCQEIDIIGINSYAGAASLGDRYKKLGGTKPYILTEFGPAGIWETGKNAIGTWSEPTSTEKAETYRRAYQGAVLGQPGVCLGSYAFLWGQKQEVTSTWFSMFLSDGSRLAPVDAIGELWTGKPPANRCPILKSLKLDGVASGEPGATIHATLDVSDPENDPLKVTWLLQRDAEEFGSGGDKEEAPPAFPESIVRGDATGAEVRLPKDGGLYRLFAIVRDNHGGAAVGNAPLRVNGPASIAKARRAELPLTVYAEENDQPSFIPAGWMGDTKSIRLDPACADRPQSGKTCMRCEFAAGAGWGGVVWQSPPGDWGDRAGGYDLTGAKKLTFWARGEKGGEVVSFQFGIIPRDKKFFDTGKGALDKALLTRDWQRYEIPAAGQDLTRIKTGFVWTLASPGQPVVFYLDNVRWE
jgi:glycosyl hydrolase family 2